MNSPSLEGKVALVTASSRVFSTNNLNASSSAALRRVTGAS